MSEKFDEKMKRKLNRTLNVTLFFTYFLHMFFPLVLIGVVLILVGLFTNKILCAIGIGFFALDAILSFSFIRRFRRMQSQNPEFERFRQAMNGENPFQDLNTLTDEWGGNGLYAARVETIKEEAESCKTVKDMYEIYKKYCMSLGVPTEEFIVTVNTEVYFMDEQKHFVISFVRQREINDDVLCNLYMDLLYEPGTKSLMLNKTFRSSESESTEDFFNKVDEFLDTHELLDLPLEQTNIGTDE